MIPVRHVVVSFLVFILSACHASVATQAARAASGESRPNIVFVDNQPLTLLVRGDDTAVATIPVVNNGSAKGVAAFCVLAGSPDCTRHVEIEGSTSDIAGEIVALRIRIPAGRMPLNGYLGLLAFGQDGTQVAASFRPLKVNAALFPTLAWYPIGGGIACAFVLCIFCARLLREEEVSLYAPMGNPKWDFLKSWASNVTVAGALLSSGLSLAALPDQMHFMHKGGYAALNLLFIILVAVAPFLFNVFRKPMLDRPTDDGVETHGYVLSFLVASGVTIAATIAQMITLALLIDELRAGGLASIVPVRGFQILLALFAIGIIAYCAETLYWTAKGQVLRRPMTLEKRSFAPAKLVAAPDARQPAPGMSNWAPL